MTLHQSGMEKLKQKFAHRDRISANSLVNNTSSPPKSQPGPSNQPSNQATSSFAKSEAVGAGGAGVSNTEDDHPWGLKVLYNGINPIVE